MRGTILKQQSSKKTGCTPSTKAGFRSVKKARNIFAQ